MKQRILNLGYQLDRNQIDMFGRKRAYRVAPIIMAGSTCYFDKAEDVWKWIHQVEQVRAWLEE